MIRNSVFFCALASNLSILFPVQVTDSSEFWIVLERDGTHLDILLLLLLYKS